MIKHLIKIANKLDSRGMVKEADSLDLIIGGLLKSAAASDLPEGFMAEYNRLSAEEKASLGNMIVQDPSVPFGFSGDSGSEPEAQASGGGSWEAPYEPGGSILWNSTREDPLGSAMDAARQHQLLTSSEVEQFKEIEREEREAAEERRSEMSLFGKAKDSLGFNLGDPETRIDSWLEKVLQGEVTYDEFQSAKEQMLSSRSTYTDPSPQGWQW